MRENIEGACLLAKASTNYDLPLLTLSSDLVFDGESQNPYFEHDVPQALNVYGWSKQVAEREVLAVSPRSLIVRTSSFFGPWDEDNFLTRSLRQLDQGIEQSAVSDWIVSPTYVPDLANVSLDLLIDGATGLWHLVNDGQISWYRFLCQAAESVGLDTSLIKPSRLTNCGFLAPRPKFSALTSREGAMLPKLSESLAIYGSHWKASCVPALQNI